MAYYGELDDLDDVVRSAMDEWQIPGLSLAVVKPGEPPHVKGYGLRDVEAVLPVTPDTQFLLASITKSFTAAGLGMLVDEGRLDWTKPVRDFIPEFRLHDARATELATVQDLLCHRSGLPRHDWLCDPGDLSREQMLPLLRYLEPTQQFATGFQYSNLGYMVAGMVSERVTGHNWEKFTHERIMKPLDMANVGFSHEDLENAADSARPYVMHEKEPGVFKRLRMPLWPVMTGADGAINAAAADMASYMLFHLNDGQADGRQLLSVDRVRELRAPRVFCFKSEFDEIGHVHYGFGLQSHLYRGEQVAQHSGGWPGWHTLMVMLPNRRAGVTVLTNRNASPVPDIVAWAAVDRLCGMEPVPWLDRHRERRRAFIAQRPAEKEAQKAARRTNAPPRPLEEYTGDYDHPAYGRMTLKAADDGLKWFWRGLSSDLIHRHYETFEVAQNPMALSPDDLPITFAYDRAGEIDRLYAPLEPEVADIVFKRVPGAETIDPAALASCVGVYERAAVKHIVALEGDHQLTLFTPGQPLYELVPLRPNIFGIKGLEGYQVEFKRAATGLVDAIVFHQPNGIFLARRAE
jgi:CubicO group peptidase (beta-lactamase class C family)